MTQNVQIFRASKLTCQNGQRCMLGNLDSYYPKILLAILLKYLDIIDQILPWKVKKRPIAFFLSTHKIFCDQAACLHQMKAKVYIEIFQL